MEKFIWESKCNFFLNSLKILNCNNRPGFAPIYTYFTPFGSFYKKHFEKITQTKEANFS